MCLLTAGVLHLAVKHYERVLDSVAKRMSAADDAGERHAIRQNSQSWEAAHNLVLIYSASGSMDLVERRSADWLALTD